MEPKIDKVKIIVNQQLLDHCESEITGLLVRDFCTFIEYGRVPEFVGRLRNRGHRLIARWGEDILLETSSDHRTWSSILVWEQWQLQQSLETCQKWKLQTSLMGNVISRNLGPLLMQSSSQKSGKQWVL